MEVTKARHPTRGGGNFSRSLRPAPPVVDQSIGRSCASENQSKCVSHFPIGAMGTFEHEHALLELYCQ
jgi:hypothetical protein